MAYLSKSSLLKLRKIAIGIEAIRNNDCICESYVLGRQTAKLYDYHLPRGRYKIDVLYVDVVYSLIELFDRCKYFVSIIDNYT